ncbi:MAG: hypothetical protein H7X92_09350 [Chitinophagales bacterium]|nr:hypothetical protein [Hyphomicrobiales bacterium]
MDDEAARELERRLELLSDPAHQGQDFDAASWFWLFLFGIALPAALIVWGIQL